MELWSWLVVLLLDVGMPLDGAPDDVAALLEVVDDVACVPGQPVTAAPRKAQPTTRRQWHAHGMSPCTLRPAVAWPPRPSKNDPLDKRRQAPCVHQKRLEEVQHGPP